LHNLSHTRVGWCSLSPGPRANPRVTSDRRKCQNVSTESLAIIVDSLSTHVTNVSQGLQTLGNELFVTEHLDNQANIRQNNELRDKLRKLTEFP